MTIGAQDGVHVKKNTSICDETINPLDADLTLQLYFSMSVFFCCFISVNICVLHVQTFLMCILFQHISTVHTFSDVCELT